MASEINKLRIERLAWVLIYGGLLTLVLGIFLERQGRSLGVLFQMNGTATAALGAVLIYVRSRMK